MNNIWLTFGLVVIILYRIVSYRLLSNSYIPENTKEKKKKIIQKQCSSPIVIAVAIKNSDVAKLNSYCNDAAQLYDNRKKKYAEKIATREEKEVHVIKLRMRLRCESKNSGIFVFPNLGSIRLSWFGLMNLLLIEASACLFFIKRHSDLNLERIIFFEMFIAIAMIVCLHCDRDD